MVSRQRAVDPLCTQYLNKKMGDYKIATCIDNTEIIQNCIYTWSNQTFYSHLKHVISWLDIFTARYHVYSSLETKITHPCTNLE